MKQPDVKVLTPEHVEITLVPAGLGSRFLAMLMDMAIVICGGMFASQFLIGVLGSTVGNFATYIVVFLFTWGYYVYFDVRHQGRSFGKFAMGLRVVDRRGLPISIQQSFVRNIVRAIDMAPIMYGLGGIVALMNRNHRRLGDIAADTLVIQDAQPMMYTGQLGEALRYNSLQTPRMRSLIRHKIGLEEREFLLTLSLRADTMDAKERYDLMESVGSYYRQKLGIEDDNLSGESLVRALTAIVYEKYQPVTSPPPANATLS